jgi:hypothetical protein
VHESFANYSESLYTECRYGPAAGAAYVIGTRPLVQNDRPVVGPFGVNVKGSGDMYTKGGNMLHTIRHVLGDDERWVGILRGLNAEFRHRVVTGKQVQEYISAQAGIRLDKVFQQYLTTTRIPVFEYRLQEIPAFVPVEGRGPRVRHADGGESLGRQVGPARADGIVADDRAAVGASGGLPGRRELLRRRAPGGLTGWSGRV